MGDKISLIKKAIRTLDFFGESFTFTFKDNDKHSTLLGGVVCILLFIIALIYLIYNFIPFYNKEIFSLQYYTMNLYDTEEIKLLESPMAFAFGLLDDNKNKTKYHLSELLDIKVKFKNGNESKNLKYHSCRIDDFHNKHSKVFNDLNISNYECLSSNDLISPKGIFTGKNFSYYVISVVSKYKDNETHNQIINDYLTEYDCKLQFYYTDITINIDNVKNPFSSFVNSMFLQLNPTLIQKKNIFFMNYHLYDDNHILHIDRKEDKQDIKTGLSRVEDYSLYKGLNRTFKKVEDYEAYAKIYIRADNKKIEIKRRYQDFMEYYADSSCLLLSIFWILGKIFAYYDKIKANHSISKKLFYFEGIKGNKFQELKKIKDFIELKRESETKDNINISNDSERPGQNSKDKSNIQYKKEMTKQLMDNFEKKFNNKNNQFIDFSTYNILEMLLSFKICICKTKKLKLKVDLIKQARKIIKDKLDIVYYIRNIFKLELKNQIKPKNKEIFDFLSRPIIRFGRDENKAKYITDKESIITNASNKIKEKADDKVNKEKEDIINSNEINLKESNYLKDEIYKSAYKLNTDELTKSINILHQKKSETESNKNLFNILNARLKDV